MKKISLALVAFALLSAKAEAKELVGTEEFASQEECRASIRQYAKDTETWKRHDGKFKKVTWTGADSVKLEHSGLTETLTCQGKVATHKVFSG